MPWDPNGPFSSGGKAQARHIQSLASRAHCRWHGNQSGRATGVTSPHPTGPLGGPALFCGDVLRHADPVGPTTPNKPTHISCAVPGTVGGALDRALHSVHSRAEV